MPPAASCLLVVCTLSHALCHPNLRRTCCCNSTPDCTAAMAVAQLPWRVPLSCAGRRLAGLRTRASTCVPSLLALLLRALSSSSPLLPALPQVFGQVVEGLDVVKKVEGYGSGSGRTSQTITVSDCGKSCCSFKRLERTLGVAAVLLACLPGASQALTVLLSPLPSCCRPAVLNAQPAASA